MTSFSIAFGNKSPVFLNENRIARTKLLSMPVINILHVPYFTKNNNLQGIITLRIASHN